MIVDFRNLKDALMCIYKLNFNNGFIYIGKTIDLKRRMYEHNNHKKANSLCDKEIIKNGKIYNVEILEIVRDKNDLDRKEAFWIRECDSTNREIGYNILEEMYMTGEYNHKSILTNKDVEDIRKRRFYGERKIDVYNNMYSHIKFNTFENIWLGNGYKDVGKDFMIKTNSIERAVYSSVANSGENNAKSKLTKQDVLAIREMYDNGMTIREIHLQFKFVAENTINRVCNRITWKNI